MFQGHKAAYYVLAALEGERHPTPYRPRLTAPEAGRGRAGSGVGKTALQEPKFLGIGKEPFADAEGRL